MQRVQEGGRCLCLSLHWPPFLSHSSSLAWLTVCELSVSSNEKSHLSKSHGFQSAGNTCDVPRGMSSDNAFHWERAAVNLCVSFTLCFIRPYLSVSIIEEVVSWWVCALQTPGCKHDTSHGMRNHVWVTLCMWCNTSKKMSPKRAHKIWQRIIFCYDYLEVVFPWKAKSVFDMLFQILTTLSFPMSVLVSCSIFVRALNLPKTLTN